MNERQVLREVMSLRDWSQQKLADEVGLKRQSNISNMLNNSTKGIRVDSLVKLLDVMGCEIVVRDKMGSKKEWVIDGKDNSPASPSSPTIEELLQAGKITFDDAIAKGWRPSPEMLTKMLG